MAASTAGVLQPSIPPFFNRTAEAAFPAMCDTMPLPAANPPGAPALAAFPNGGGVLERGLRRHLKAQGPARPRARRVAPSSPAKVVGDGPIGNLCSAAFAADSSSYAIGCARASKGTHANLLLNDLPRRTAHWPTLRVTLSVFGTQARGGWRCAAGFCSTPGCCSADPCAADSCAGCPSAADSSTGGPCAGCPCAADSCAADSCAGCPSAADSSTEGSCDGVSCAGVSCADYMRVGTLGYAALHGEAFADRVH